VADGNFKADHVRQKNEVDDVWLSEGSGMIPRRQEYLTFLATAIERLTVSGFRNKTGRARFQAIRIVPEDKTFRHWFTHSQSRYINLSHLYRKPLVKTRSEPLPMPYKPQSYAT
jgi:hypothetical protein